jgi:hypothetical protein
MYVIAMIISGFDFTSDILDRIKGLIVAKPDISRVQLSRAVCGIFNWRTAAGKLKEMSCRVALLKLNRLGELKLPAAQPFRNIGGRPSARLTCDFAIDEVEKIDGTLKSLSPIEIIRIDSAGSKSSRQWNEIMKRYHYLGSGPLCGAQIRYLFRDNQQRLLGGFAFSAAAFSIKCRDSWIGWSSSARKENLQRVIGNSRFLIMPNVTVAHLASHVLGIISRRIAEDWKIRYGYEPLLLETFVEAQRFKGTSYRAANWRHIGESAGRSRQDRTNSLRVPVKDLYVYELQKDARTLLQQSTEPHVVQQHSVDESRPQDWAEEELGGAKLGDKRLERRLLSIARDFWAYPQANIPKACGQWAKIKAAYRFFDNAHTTMDAILTSHYQATIQRIKKQDIVLAVQDTTEFNYAAHPSTTGLGPIGTEKDGAIGLFVHDTLAMTPDGTPLGLLNVQCWARDKEEFGKRERCHDLPIEEKESFKWLLSYRAAREVQKQCPNTQIISIADRESDIYELFTETLKEQHSPKLLIRARYERPLAEKDGGHVWKSLRAKEVDTLSTVMIPRHKDHPARVATLQVRFAKVTLKPPKRKPHLGKMTLWAVAATEVGQPIGCEPVEWLLLTNIEIATADDALQALHWYSRRWGVEVYHRTMKSGCKIEERQLGCFERIQTCLAVDMIIAWRVYYLTKLGRETPDMPCTVFFEDYEWKALVTHIDKKAPLDENPPSLRDATRMVASLGGFIGRKNDGEPGTQTTWLGLECLAPIAIMFKFMAETYAPHLLSPSVLTTLGYG